MLIDLQTRENIDKYCEKFEKDMLHLFDRAYRRSDPKMMHASIDFTFCAYFHADMRSSIAHKHSWISTAALPVFKCT